MRPLARARTRRWRRSSGRRCGSASSIAMPPRSPTARPRGARQLVARADAGREHDHVGRRARCRRRTPAPRARRRRRRRSPAWSVAGVHVDAQLLDRRAQHARRRRRRPAAAISRGANSTTCVSRPRSRSAFAASRPSRPPPITTPTLRALRGLGADRLEVLDRAVDEAAAARRARRPAARTAYEPVASTSLS